MDHVEPANVTIHSWSGVQATDWSSVQPAGIFLPTPSTPHVQTRDSYLVLRGNDGIVLVPDKSWVLTLEARRINEPLGGYDIILGPRKQCNCQIRFEADNTLGVYATNSGYGIYRSNLHLPLNSTEFHAITIVYHRMRKRIVLYQDSKLVDKWDATDFFAEFGYIGSWFKGNYPANIAVKRILFIEEEDAEDKHSPRFGIRKHLWNYGFPSTYTDYGEK